MVAVGTLQLKKLVINADINDRSKTSASTMSDVIVYDKENLLKQHIDIWSKKQRPKLRIKVNIDNTNVSYRQVYAQLRNYIRDALNDKIEIIALGQNRTVDTIINQTRLLLTESNETGDYFGFNLTTYCYKDFEILKTGLYIHNDDRVANLVKPGGLGNYG